jgi:hypothetical protein
MSNNMHDFNRCAAMVLTMLHEAFPNPCMVFVDSLDDSADKATLKTFTATIQFLHDEGFIRYDSIQAGGLVFDSATLTAKGLTILNAVPDAIKEREDLASKIKKTLTEGSKEALKTLVGKLLSLGLGSG